MEPPQTRNEHPARATSALALALLALALAGAARPEGWLFQFPPAIAGFGLVLAARRREGGVAAALLGLALLADLAWANRLTQGGEGFETLPWGVALDLFCCGAAGGVLALAALAVFLTPRRATVERPGVDRLAVSGFVLVVVYVIGMTVWLVGAPVLSEAGAG